MWSTGTGSRRLLRGLIGRAVPGHHETTSGGHKDAEEKGQRDRFEPTIRRMQEKGDNGIHDRSTAEDNRHDSRW